MSLGTGILPDVSLGNIDLMESRWFTLREFGSKAQNLLSLIGASVSSTCAVVMTICILSTAFCVYCEPWMIDCDVTYYRLDGTSH